MSVPMVVTFPAASATALMPSTTNSANMNLITNTILPKTYNITITSTGDVSASTFLVSGTDVNGIAISEWVAGETPNVHAISGLQFLTVSSIVSYTAGVPAAVANVFAGVIDLIALTQPITPPAAALLNVGDNPALTFLPLASAYTVALTAIDDQSAVTFTIVGTAAGGAPANEPLMGPNAGTVYSVNTYNSIISITPDMAVDNITAGVEDYIATLQTTPASGLFTLANTGFPSQAWTLGFSSANNLSASTFTIVGSAFGGAVTENLTGPNADMVDSADQYSTVTSISVNGSVTGIAVSVPNYVAPIQTIGAGLPAVLNQDVVSFGLNPSTGLNQVYQISLTAAGDNSGTTFTIVGTDVNGNTLSENVVGPDADTVLTPGFYNSVSSIGNDNGGTDISFGIYGAIAASQNVTAIGVASLPVTGGYPIVFPNAQRKVNLTSTNDLAGITVTITGTDLYNNVFTEVLTGPNNATVTSLYPYHTITSLVASGNYYAMSMGTDSAGVLQWLPLNTLNEFPNTTIAAVVTPTINYTVNQSITPVGFYEYVGSTVTYNYPRAVKLGTNPILTANGSAVVTVTVPSTAGLQNGDIVTLQGSQGTIHAITQAQLNINSAITIVDATHFTFTSNGSGNAGVPNVGGTSMYYYYPALPQTFPVVAAMTAATTNQLYTLTTPAAGLQAIINSSTAPGTLTLTVTQQGIV